MDRISIDPNVEVIAQLEGGQTGPIVFAALFHVPPEDADKLIAAWYGENEWVTRQPGYISRELVRGRAGSDVFIDYCKWESAASYKVAMFHPEHVKLLEPYGPIRGSSALHLLDPTTNPKG